VNRCDVVIWGSQNPHQVVAHVRDGPNMNGFCAVGRTQVYGPLFFAETIITGHVYLDMCEHFLVPQMNVNSVIWQQDCVSPYYYRDVTRCLNQTLQRRSTCRGDYITVKLRL
jgi:hypothetical protein